MEQALKQTTEITQNLESIYPDYDVWMAAASWGLEEAAWLLAGLDPALAGINNRDLSKAAQEDLRQYEMTFGKHLMLVDQYRVLIGDSMARRAEREWIIGADGGLEPARFLQWCFDQHIGWHERLQRHLDESGRTFRYSDDSDMLRAIKRLAKQDCWLLWDAALLTLGFNPDMAMTTLIRRPNLQPGRDRFDRDALAQAGYLADTARGSWRAGKLDIANDDEVRKDLSLFMLCNPTEPQAEVFPKPFLLWAQDKG